MKLKNLAKNLANVKLSELEQIRNIISRDDYESLVNFCKDKGYDEWVKKVGV